MCGIGTAPFYALFFLDKEGPSGKEICPKHALFCACMHVPTQFASSF
jgi:hypothetical protein